MGKQKISRIAFIVYTTIALTGSCQNTMQNTVTMEHLSNRKPAVSGQFYPANANTLKNDLSKYFDTAVQQETYAKTRALIVPHAGYMYSGAVAASAYAHLNPNQKYHTVFILAPSHHQSFNGASIYNAGNYETPLGIVEVDREICKQITNNNKHFFYHPTAHIKEHSIEVQLPFLQYWLKPGYKIIPILIGTQNLQILKSLANTLASYYNDSSLFIISTDFSHFPSYADALVADKNMADAIEKNSIEALQKAIKLNENLKIKNLVTSACGMSGLFTLLYLTQNNPSVAIKPIQYKNSGDLQFSPKDRVVGYWAFQITDQPLKNTFTLTVNDKSILLNIARETLKSYLKNKTIPQFDTSVFNEVLFSNNGAFVSLHLNDALRGCIGRFESKEPLYKLVQQMAIASATQDNRFKPLSINELEQIKIEISVLTPMVPIKSADDIELGKHGIYIKQGYNHGTLLPQVAVNNNWSVTEFLGYCSKNKAGLGWDGWKQASVYTYEAIVFSE